MGGPNNFPNSRHGDLDTSYDGRGRKNFRPNQIEGQLTMPPYITVSEPSNAEIILRAVADGRLEKREAEADIAALGEMAVRASNRPVE